MWKLLYLRRHKEIIQFWCYFLAILKLQGLLGPGSTIRWDKHHTNMDILVLKAAFYLIFLNR